MKIIFTALACFALWGTGLLTPAVAQVNRKDSAPIKDGAERPIIIDEWPITVPTNDRRKLRIMKKAEGSSSNFGFNGGSWNRCNLTYAFANITPDINGNGGIIALQNAFAIWAAQSSLTFTQVQSTAQADIVILWAAGNHGDGFSFDGQNGVLAHAFTPPPVNGGAIAGDIHFDEDEAWVDMPRSAYSQPIDLLPVAIHEIGHALGLDHSTTPGAIMNPSYLNFYNQRTLGSDDIAGIQSIYGPPVVIAGPGVVCGGSVSYAVNGYSSVSWSSSNPGVASINASTGVVTVVGSGSVTITAVATTGCGAVTTTKDIVVNSAPPAIELVQTRHDDCKLIEQYRILNYNPDVTYTLTTNNLSSLSSLNGNYLFIKGRAGMGFGEFSITATACSQSTSADGWVEWYECDTPTGPTPIYRNAQPVAAYPNPASASLTIPEGAKQAVLTNSQGNSVQQVDKTGNMDVRNLPNGLYNLRMQVDGKTVNQHIQVQH